MTKATKSFKLYVNDKPLQVTLSKRLSELLEKDPIAFGNFQMNIYELCYFVEDNGITRIYNRETKELEMILERALSPQEIDVWKDFPF